MIEVVLKPVVDIDAMMPNTSNHETLGAVKAGEDGRYHVYIDGEHDSIKTMKEFAQWIADSGQRIVGSHWVSRSNYAWERRFSYHTVDYIYYIA